MRLPDKAKALASAEGGGGGGKKPKQAESPASKSPVAADVAIEPEVLNLTRLRNVSRLEKYNFHDENYSETQPMALRMDSLHDIAGFVFFKQPRGGGGKERGLRVGREMCRRKEEIRDEEGK